MRTLAIGDIHGCSTLVDDLLGEVKCTPEDRLIFLGDYVDRGPDSRGVLERLIAISKVYPKSLFLRGNHELMMLRSRTDRGESRGWLSVGGTQTLGSYGASPGRMGTMADVPAEHWEFMEQTCLDWYETDSHIFVHAGVDPTLPMSEQIEIFLYWEFLSKSLPPERHISGKRVICGHSSQKSGEVLALESTVCIDTYAYGGGWLTALDVDTGDYWQVNLVGKKRRGIIS